MLPPVKAQKRPETGGEEESAELDASKLVAGSNLSGGGIFVNFLCFICIFGEKIDEKLPGEPK